MNLMIGIDSGPPTVRCKSTIDTNILKSKIGHAILKGGTFYSKALNKTLHQLTQDVKTEIRIINRQMRILLEKNQKNMKRSEKLVTTYNLPPIKPGVNKKSEKLKLTPDICVTGQSIQGFQAKDNQNKNLSFHDAGKAETENPREAEGQNKNSHLTAQQDSKMLRRTFCSPVPTKHLSDLEDKNVEDEMTSIHIPSSAFPHITVDQCEELFPPIKKESVQRPEYALSESQSRTGSTNSLGVPSPLIERRSTDGKVVNIVIPSNSLGESNLSRSEGSIPDAFKQKKGKDDPRFKALEAVLKPATTYRAQTRTPTKNLQQTKEEARRTVSRSVSPKPRFPNTRTNSTSYQYRAATTPP